MTPIRRRRNIDALNVDRLREVLNYNPVTGVFTWRFRLSPKASLTAAAGCIKECGYRRIVIEGKSYLASHLAWLHFYGEVPPALVDHKNRDKTDDRIENLREATSSENARNRKCRASSTTGLKGASRLNDRFRSSITVDGKRTFLGIFDTAEEAHEAYKQAAVLHGEFAHVPDRETPMVSLTVYNARRDLIAKRNATSDPIKREQIAILIEQMEEHDRAEDDRKPLLAAAMARQIELMRRTA